MKTEAGHQPARWIPVAAPKLGHREKEYVIECLDSTWISSAGRFVKEFEAAFAQRCGVRHAVSVNNGTTALHLALVALGVGPGDEVIVPTLTYIATANAVRYCGAKPVFVDCEERTFNLEPSLLKKSITNRTRGIIPVHLYGHPCDMDPILEIAEQHGLFVLEDAAEAVGARYKGRNAGALGTCATFSFFGNKLLTTGEGGMVTTDDDELAARMRLFRGQGMDPERRYWFPVVGYNYRMTNVAAAIGLAQLEHLDEALQTRADVARAYDRELKPLQEHLILPHTEAWALHSFWMYTIVLRHGDEQRRDALMQHLETQGIETRPVFYPMHVLPPYKDQESEGFPVADSVSSRGINLPTHALLTNDDIRYIASVLTNYFS
jgi:perosamine synthetase